MVITNILRAIHILAGTAWLGEVVVVNFVLIPVLARLEPDKRGWFLSAVFPRIFQLASVLSLTTILAGASLNLSLSDWQVDVAVSRLFARNKTASCFPHQRLVCHQTVCDRLAKRRPQ